MIYKLSTPKYQFHEDNMVSISHWGQFYMPNVSIYDFAADMITDIRVILSERGIETA